MSKKAKTKTQVQRAEPKGKAHALKNGKCAICARVGADLKAACPGYQTAADYIDWTQPLPVAKARKQAVAVAEAKAIRATRKRGRT